MNQIGSQVRLATRTANRQSMPCVSFRGGD
jgi:hypothetical protein